MTCDEDVRIMALTNPAHEGSFPIGAILLMHLFITLEMDGTAGPSTATPYRFPNSTILYLL